MTLNLNKILLIVAVVLLAVAGLISIEVIESDDWDAFFTFGVLLGFASFLP